MWLGIFYLYVLAHDTISVVQDLLVCPNTQTKLNLRLTSRD